MSARESCVCRRPPLLVGTRALGFGRALCLLGGSRSYPAFRCVPYVRSRLVVHFFVGRRRLVLRLGSVTIAGGATTLLSSARFVSLLLSGAVRGSV